MILPASFNKKNLLKVTPAIAIGLVIAWFITNSLEGLVRARNGLKNVSVSEETEVLLDPSSEKGTVYDDTFILSTATASIDKIVSIEKPVLLSLPNLVLNGILISDKGNFAIINNQVMGKGEDVRGGVIAEINKSEVIIIFGSQELTLSLN